MSHLPPTDDWAVGTPRAAPVRPGKLLLRTNGACDFDPAHLLEVFGQQRQRFAAVLQGFGPGDWAARTRCADWSAHDVARHLCDCNVRAAALGPDDRTIDLTAGFDPRTTPRQWLATSAGESPGATFSRFLATTDKLLALARARLARGHRFDVRMPYGPVDWTVGALHGFWDSWLHERDVLLARGAEHPTGSDATGYAAAYGVFIAAAVASRFGDPVQEKLTLGGDGGGVFDLNSRDGFTLTVTRATTPGAARSPDHRRARRPPTGRRRARRPPASSRAGLSRMADFFNTPVGQGLLPGGGQRGDLRRRS